jgi:hypothetical protein
MPAATFERPNRSYGTPLRLRGGGGVLDTLRCSMVVLICLLLMCMPAATFERPNRSYGTPLRLRGGGGVLDTLRCVKRRDDRLCNSIRYGGFDVLFLGTGVSTAVPRIGCIVRPDQSQPVCTVCHDALRRNSRNRRGNVSILVVSAAFRLTLESFRRYIELITSFLSC